MRNKTNFQNLEKSKNGGSISLTVEEKSITVLERERSLKEGWWKTDFPKTSKGYKDALKLYNKL